MDLVRSLSVLSVSLLASLGLVACGEAHASVDTGREHVVDAFTAVTAHDCEALRRLMPRLTDDEECNDFIADSESHGLTLLEVVESQNDGRDPHAVIVRCRVRMEGEERDMLVRAVEDEHGGWAVSM